MTRFAFTLLLPPPELSPNSRANRWKRGSATKQYRGDCKKVATSKKNMSVRKARASKSQPPTFPLSPPVTATVTVFYKVLRKRDGDNLQAMLKAMWDGLQDAGVLVGDDTEVLTVKPPIVVVDKNAEARVEVVLE